MSPYISPELKALLYEQSVQEVIILVLRICAFIVDFYGLIAVLVLISLISVHEARKRNTKRNLE